MTARKPAKKSPAKRKPRPKNPDPSIEFSDLSPETQKRLAEIIDSKHPPSDDSLPSDGAQAGYAFPAWAKYIAMSAVGVIIGGLAGVFACGGIPIGPDGVVKNDELSQSYAADRITQVAVLRELATQPFDGTTDDGRKQAGEWFNDQRFRNRANDFGGYTDRVAESIAANAESELAAELEAK